MARKKLQYECNACGHRASKWLGRCPDCSEWNTFVECEPEVAPDPRAMARPRTGSSTSNGPIPITELPDDGGGQRWCSGLSEFDRILGGGLVPGS